jgi:hypothetical protein
MIGVNDHQAGLAAVQGNQYHHALTSTVLRPQNQAPQSQSTMSNCVLSWCLLGGSRPIPNRNDLIVGRQVASRSSPAAVTMMIEQRGGGSIPSIKQILPPLCPLRAGP